MPCPGAFCGRCVADGQERSRALRRRSLWNLSGVREVLRDVLIRRPWVAVLFVWWVPLTMARAALIIRVDARERWQADAVVFAVIACSAVMIWVLARKVATAKAVSAEVTGDPYPPRAQPEGVAMKLARDPVLMLGQVWAFSQAPLMVAMVAGSNWASMWGLWAALVFAGGQSTWYVRKIHRELSPHPPQVTDQ